MNSRVVCSAACCFGSVSLRVCGGVRRLSCSTQPRTEARFSLPSVSLLLSFFHPLEEGDFEAFVGNPLTESASESARRRVHHHGRHATLTEQQKDRVRGGETKMVLQSQGARKGSRRHTCSSTHSHIHPTGKRRNYTHGHALEPPSKK